MIDFTNKIETEISEKDQMHLASAAFRAYAMVLDIQKRNEMFQSQDSKAISGLMRRKAYGFVLKTMIDSGLLKAEYTQERVHNHFYDVFKIGRVLFTLSKVTCEGTMPKKSIFREQFSLMNRQTAQLSLFDDEQEEVNPDQIYALLTYGHSTRKVLVEQPDFVCVSIPDRDYKRLHVSKNISNLLMKQNKGQVIELPKKVEKKLVEIREGILVSLRPTADDDNEE